MNNFQLNGCQGTTPGCYGYFSVLNKLEMKVHVCYTEADKKYNVNMSKFLYLYIKWASTVATPPNECSHSN